MDIVLQLASLMIFFIGNQSTVFFRDWHGLKYKEKIKAVAIFQNTAFRWYSWIGLIIVFKLQWILKHATKDNNSDDNNIQTHYDTIALLMTDICTKFNKYTHLKNLSKPLSSRYLKNKNLRIHHNTTVDMVLEYEITRISSLSQCSFVVSCRSSVHYISKIMRTVYDLLWFVVCGTLRLDTHMNLSYMLISL